MLGQTGPYRISSSTEKLVALLHDTVAAAISSSSTLGRGTLARAACDVADLLAVVPAAARPLELQV